MKKPLISYIPLVVFAIISLIVLGTCLGTQLPKSSKSISVIYEVTGSAKYVDITLNNSEGGTEQYSDIKVPCHCTYDNFIDNFLYLSAQNQGEYGSVTVTIYVNDKVFKTSTSIGTYVIATASGSKIELN